MAKPQIVGNDGAPMALIAKGSFQMGDHYSEGSADERPVHTVYLDAYYVDVYLVTNRQYEKFVAATGHKAPDCWDDPDLNAPDHPVVGVGWSDAAAYAEWAGKRLPTEAEWEKAARGGLVGKRYPWGNAPIDGTQCNFADKNKPTDHHHAEHSHHARSEIDAGYAYTSPVDAYPPNGYGLYDMAGNVWEWCLDDLCVYAPGSVRNPVGPLTEGRRALRGGDWAGPIYHQRCARRGRGKMDIPGGNSGNVGFRCARDASPA